MIIVMVSGGMRSAYAALVACRENPEVMLLHVTHEGVGALEQQRRAAFVAMRLGVELVVATVAGPREGEPYDVRNHLFPALLHAEPRCTGAYIGLSRWMGEGPGSATWAEKESDTHRVRVVLPTLFIPDAFIGLMLTLAGIWPKKLA